MKLTDFDSLTVGAIFYVIGNQFVGFRKTPKGVTFGCYRRGVYCFRRSADYGPESFRGAMVEVYEKSNNCYR